MCIRDTHGVVRGAGVVLGDRHVLTCAHVVMAACDLDESTADSGKPSTWAVQAEFVGHRPAVPPVLARVVPDCWFPPLADERADVALLELAEPLPDGTGPLLRRLPLSARRTVRMYGFPPEIPTGVWAHARLAGECGPGGEWIQMDAGSKGPRVRPGFSGAAVFDEETDQVVGIVVTHFTDDSAALSWMIPVETVIRYLPRVREWVSGASAVDASFAEWIDPSGADESVSRRVISFFARRAPAGTMIIVTESGSAALAALRDVVLRSSREFRPADVDRGEAARAYAEDPLLGSIDLALDVSGKTVAEVSGRIVNWMNVGVDHPTPLADSLAGEPPPMNLVLDGIDEAADPDALVSEVVRPLADRAAERDIRLLLVFRDQSSPSLTQAALRALTARVAEVRAAERLTRERYDQVAARVTPVPTPTFKAPSLRLRLTALRAAAGQPGDAPVLPGIESCQRAAERALDSAKQVRQRLDELLGERDRLRDRLDGYRAGVPGGLREDIALAALYGRAREALWHGPADLSTCTDLVDRYGALVRQRSVDLADRSGEVR